MENEKLISCISTIERALGIIEGASRGLEDIHGEVLMGAVKMIEGALKEIRDGKR